MVGRVVGDSGKIPFRPDRPEGNLQALWVGTSEFISVTNSQSGHRCIPGGSRRETLLTIRHFDFTRSYDLDQLNEQVLSAFT